MRAFRDAVDDCSLQDLGWRGIPYTWDNRQPGLANVKARLDRALANEGFLNLFQSTSVKHVSSVESDHCFVVAELRTNMNNKWPRAKRNFRYEEVWQSHSQYDKLVRDMWQTGAGQRGLQGVVEALGTVQKDLGAWGEREFGNLQKKVRCLQKRLDRLRSVSMGRGPNEEENAVASQLREAMRQEEIWLKQRSRVLWLRVGDRNTGYFQAQAAHRKRINRITSLEISQGHILQEPKEVKAEISSFYHALYQTQGFHPMDDLLNCVQPAVTNQMNDYLNRPYVAAEVKKALFDMAPSKAPGVDGFTAGFYQRHWEVLGEDIIVAVLQFLNGGELPLGLNNTSITLIPKVRHPQKISQFRPIALCHVIYKIAVKAIANRVRGILDEVIGEEQSAFVPGRLIFDNVLTTYVCIHYMKRKKGKSVDCAMKLDMTKAYDRMNGRT